MNYCFIICIVVHINSRNTNWEEEVCPFKFFFFPNSCQQTVSAHRCTVYSSAVDENNLYNYSVDGQVLGRYQVFSTVWETDAKN